jgi:hypothetical protein
MTEQARKPGRGCLFYMLLALAISIAVLSVASYLGYRYAKSLINQFTDTEPMQVPTVEISEADLTRLRDRVNAFGTALQQGQAVQPLTITADEANALIASTPELLTVRGKLHFEFQGSNVVSQFSIPAEDLGLQPLKGRYVNASGTFTVGMTNGVLNVNAQSLSAKGKPLPETFMNRIQPQNFAFKLDHDPKAQEILNKVQDVQVRDGKLVIIPKAGR